MAIISYHYVEAMLRCFPVWHHLLGGDYNSDFDGHHGHLEFAGLPVLHMDEQAFAELAKGVVASACCAEDIGPARKHLPSSTASASKHRTCIKGQREMEQSAPGSCDAPWPQPFRPRC